MQIAKLGALSTLFLCSFAFPREVSTPLPVPLVRQSTSYSCGASSLHAVLKYYGLSFREDEIMKGTDTTPESGAELKIWSASRGGPEFPHRLN